MRYLMLAAAALLLFAAERWLRNRHEVAAIAHDGTTTMRDDYQEKPTPIPCPNGVPVLLIIGQSNAANYGESKASSGAVNFYRGRCYLARDPLLGATGDRGSIWTRVQFRGVLAPIAVGGSRMAEWAPGGRHFPRLANALGDLRRANLRPTHIAIIQGEYEGNSNGDPEAYSRKAKALVSYLQATGARIYMARTSQCAGEPNEAIRAAQASSGARPGPDIDAIPGRIHGCHLKDAGLAEAGRLWTLLLAAKGPNGLHR